MQSNGKVVALLARPARSTSPPPDPPKVPIEDPNGGQDHLLLIALASIVLGLAEGVVDGVKLRLMLWRLVWYSATVIWSVESPDPLLLDLLLIRQRADAAQLGLHELVVLLP